MQANTHASQPDRAVEDKVVGGSATIIDLYPYLVSISENGSYSCGGSILTEYRILTAAHCFKLHQNMSVYSILAGSTNITSGKTGLEIRVSRGLHHPKHAENRGRGDVGILFLMQALIFGPNIRPLQLPYQNESLPYGIRAHFAGWGVTIGDDITSIPNVLQGTTLLIHTNENCNRPSSYNETVGYDEFCAGPMEGGHGICKGDSGSPLVVNGIQYGIASWGNGCGSRRNPGVFTLVPFYSYWIQYSAR